jgi:hypothetical protein
MPITSWRGAATVLGLSEDTVARHRRRLRCTRTLAWWRSDDDVVRWWLALHEKPERPTRTRPVRIDRSARALDVRQLIEELSVRGDG